MKLVGTLLGSKESYIRCPLPLFSKQRGLIHESLGNHTEAKNCYESALSINPSHIKSLQNLGKLQMELGNLEMAERVLRTAVNKDPTAHQAW